MSTKLSTYQVYYKITLEVSREERAASMEEAITEARKTTEIQLFPELKTELEFIDGEIRVSGVYEA